MGPTLPRTVDATQINEALRRAGVLGSGRVREVVIDHARTTVLSRILRLRLHYDGAADDAPRTVICKTSLPEREGPQWHAGRQEVAFYTHIAPHLPTRLVPYCFDAQWEADTYTWHLVLEDLTDSHMLATTWPLPPTLEQCVSIIQTLAHCHAHWWDDARLGTSVGTWREPQALHSHLRTLAEQFQRFADRLGENLGQERRTLYERLFEAAPRLLARYEARQHLTLIHGDAHVWNALVPRDDQGQGVRFFDWDCWRVDLGTDDLAYMMALHWYPDFRRRGEPLLLERYHEALVAHGVQGYDRRALQEDYRLSVVWQLATPVWQAAHHIPPVIWWNNLERILLAVDDLGCRELLT